MRDSLKRLGVKRGSILALFVAYAVVPIPGLKGNPTGALWTHDHASRYVRVNKINLNNHKMANYKATESQRNENLIANKIQDKRMQLMLLEMRLENINSGDYDKEYKHMKIREFERRIYRLYEQLDKDGIRHEEIQSATTQLMLAEHVQ